MEEHKDMLQEVIANKQIWVNYEAYVSNAMWFKDNITKLKQQHKNNIIIVYNHKVTFNSKDPQEVRERLRSYDQNKRNQSFSFYIDPFS
jgi:hypothetical protein